MMKLSIITVCYNSEATISQTIESVLDQNFECFEYIIIDGASTDNTVTIAQSYESKFKLKNVKYVIYSAPDRGIYDAMNKGLNVATGKIIGFLNSDDCYAAADILSAVVSEFEHNHQIDSLYGNLVYLKNNKPYRYWKAGKKKTFKSGWMPPHPTFFVKKNVYDIYGTFRLDCGLNADYEIMLRFLEVYKITTLWVDRIFVYMKVGGASNKNINTRIKSFMYDSIAWEKNNIPVKKITILKKKLIKIPQFIYAKFISINK